MNIYIVIPYENKIMRKLTNLGGVKRDSDRQLSFSAYCTL